MANLAPIAPTFFTVYVVTRDAGLAKPSPIQPAPQPAPQATQQQNVQLTKQQALDIALKHAGVSQSDVRMTKVKQDYEHGKLVYEIEFRIGRTEYEYEIDAYTGDIRKYDMDND